MLKTVVLINIKWRCTFFQRIFWWKESSKEHYKCLYCHFWSS